MYSTKLDIDLACHQIIPAFLNENWQMLNIEWSAVKVKLMLKNIEISISSSLHRRDQIIVKIIDIKVLKFL